TRGKAGGHRSRSAPGRSLQLFEPFPSRVAREPGHGALTRHWRRTPPEKGMAGSGARARAGSPGAARCRLVEIPSLSTKVKVISFNCTNRGEGSVVEW